MEVGEEGECNYTYRYTVTTRLTCIKMGNDESHFNVSLIVRDKVTRPCPQTITFEQKGEPKRYRTVVRPLAVLPLASQAVLPQGQTGSQPVFRFTVPFIQTRLNDLVVHLWTGTWGFDCITTYCVTGFCPTLLTPLLLCLKLGHYRTLAWKRPEHRDFMSLGTGDRSTVSELLL